MLAIVIQHDVNIRVAAKLGQGHLAFAGILAKCHLSPLGLLHGDLLYLVMKCACFPTDLVAGLMWKRKLPVK